MKCLLCTIFKTLMGCLHLGNTYFLKKLHWKMPFCSHTGWMGHQNYTGCCGFEFEPGSLSRAVQHLHRCFRFDQATLTLGKGSCREVRFRLSRDRDKGTGLRMCTNLQGARLWCSQCNAPQNTEPLLPLRVQGHSCLLSTDTQTEQNVRY